MFTESEMEELLNINEATEMEGFINKVEDKYNLQWRPVGDKENNVGVINMGADPGEGFIERLTNAIDAILERAALENPEMDNYPDNPREAVEEWFGVKTGHLDTLTSTERRKLAKNNIQIQMYKGSKRRTPTLVIRDKGVGQHPLDFPNTLLSLNESNKLTKLYLAGAYGQGGQTTFRYSKYTIIISRRPPDLLGEDAEDVVGMTIVRYGERDPEKYKNGTYEYLVTDENEVLTIPPTELGLGNNFEGTYIKHIDFELPKYSATLTAPTGSLWWLIQSSLFDPVLPVYVTDNRKKTKSRTIAGNYTRLQSDPRDLIEKSDVCEVNLRPTGKYGKVIVRYWVLRHDPDKSYPVEAYVDKRHPIYFTHYGQTHGYLSRSFIRNKLQLPYLSKYLIVEVSCDTLTAKGKRELFSSTRERLNKGMVRDQMEEAIRTALRNDDDLRALEKQRHQEILSETSEEETQKLKEELGKLIDYVRGETETVGGTSSGDKTQTGTSKRGSYTPPEPLETREIPTYIKIANKQDPIPLVKGRSSQLKIESDAEDGYLSRQNKILLLIEPEDHINVRGHSYFDGGRLRCFLETSDEAEIGEEVSITAVLTRPNQSPLKEERKGIVKEPPTADYGEGTKRKISLPNIRRVSKQTPAWERLGWDENNVAEVKEEADSIDILVSMEFHYFKEQLEKSRYSEKWINRFKDNYTVYVAFCAWLQHFYRKEELPEMEADGIPDIPEEVFESELQRAARTIIHSLISIERLTESMNL